MNTRIEWKRDELSELRKLEREFLTLKKWYLGTTLFLVLLFALSYVCSLIDPDYRPFVVPAVLTVAFVPVFSQFFMLSGSKTSYFFDDQTLGYQQNTMHYKIKWAEIAAVQNDLANDPKLATITFQPKPAKPLIRVEFSMTVEKDSEIYRQLMAKIASQNLPVTVV